MKVCVKCNKTFPLTEKFFGRRPDSPDGFRNDCKSCIKKRRDEWHRKNREDQISKMKKYWRENREVMCLRKAEYNQANRDIMVKKSHKYYEANRAKVLSQMRDHRSKNKDEINQKRRDRFPKYAERHRQYRINNRRIINIKTAKYRANRRKNDIAFRILINLRSRIGHAVKHLHKSDRTTKLLGCSIPELRNHLAKQFKPGMSWENYGQWHIDHIIPCAAFDLKDPGEQKMCFHFSNLQPLWGIDNLKKGVSIPAQMVARMTGKDVEEKQRMGG